MPILVVVTIVALVTSTNGSGKSHSAVADTASTRHPTSAPPTATGTEQLKSDDPGAGAQTTAIAADALPAGAAYTIQGNGNYTVVPGSSAVIGTGTVHKYDIEVEGGITGIDVTAFANDVQHVLSDPRSWTAGTGTAIQRVDSGAVDFRITLTSSMTVRTLCGYDIPVETSCYAPAGQYQSKANRVVINDSRWVRGDGAYIGDVDAYRTYMINHESGHALGHEHAHQCLSDGAAPVMMQQTIGLKSTSGQMCTANPWPYPPGATDAPGAEAADSPVNNEFNLQNQ